jgi:hypothetical protein
MIDFSLSALILSVAVFVLVMAVVIAHNSWSR